MTSLNRRGLLTGLGAIIAAPAIVRAASLMPVRGIVMDVPRLAIPASILERWLVADLQAEINEYRNRLLEITRINRMPVSWWQTAA